MSVHIIMGLCGLNFLLAKPQKNEGDNYLTPKYVLDDNLDIQELLLNLEDYEHRKYDIEDIKSFYAKMGSKNTYVNFDEYFGMDFKKDDISFNEIIQNSGYNQTKNDVKSFFKKICGDKNYANISDLREALCKSSLTMADDEFDNIVSRRSIPKHLFLYDFVRFLYYAGSYKDTSIILPNLLSEE